MLAVTCGGLSVAALFTWYSLSKTGSSACRIYKQRQALKHIWLDWDCTYWAQTVQQHWVCHRNPHYKLLLHFLPMKSNCNHGSTCMSHSLISKRGIPFTCLLSYYFITPDVNISLMYEWACEWMRPIKPSIKQSNWLHSKAENSLTHISSTSYIKPITALCLWPFNW